jgi:hypothetical protein
MELETGSGLLTRKIFSKALSVSTFLIPFIGSGATQSVSDNFDRPNTGAVTSSTDPNPIGTVRFDEYSLSVTDVFQSTLKLILFQN